MTLLPSRSLAEGIELPVLRRSHSPIDVSTASLSDVLFKTPHVFACGFTTRPGLNGVGP